MLTQNDKQILRELACRYAEEAALPEMAEKRRLWLAMNECRMERPMVLMDQLPWGELSAGEESLALKVQDPYWRGVESELRMELYRRKHFPADRVVNPYISLPRPIPYNVWGGSGWGGIEVVRTGEIRGGEISSSSFDNRIRSMEDVERIEDPVFELDRVREEEIRREADELFSGIIDTKLRGISVHLGIWDSIAFWMGVEAAYIAILDEPELIHALMERLTSGMIRTVERLNAMEGMDIVSNFTHCSQTFTRDVCCQDKPAVSQNAWAYGMAQLFTSVSPRVTEEFEVDYMKRIFPMFGAIYYGCCDRLDDRMDVIRKLPKIRKLSCSPWSVREHFAEVMPDDCVMSNKPNPAYLATPTMDEDVIRADIRRTIEAARGYGRSVEFILKDVSTIQKDPARLEAWERIAMEEVQR